MKTQGKIRHGKESITGSQLEEIVMNEEKKAGRIEKRGERVKRQ